MLQSSQTALSAGEFFQEIEEHVPAFAGLTYEDGVPTAYLTRPEQAASAQAALRLFLQKEGKSDRGFRARPATYTWGQLYTWRMKARSLFSLPEMTALGASVIRNQVLVGIAPGSDPTNVRRQLRALGIPDAAVEIEEDEPVPPLSNLTDRLRPVMGGIKILPSNEADCTAGFNVLWNGMRTMMTAAHCLIPIDVNQGRVVWQPVETSTNRIGAEVADPAHVTCSDSIPHQYVCLNSDAALVRYDDSVTWSFGHIARPTFFGHYTGSTTINPAQSRFWITESKNFVLIGDTVNKVGETTGWTQGTVQAIDLDRRDGGTSIWILNSDSVDAGAGGGDSGSPAFQMSTYGKVTLVGSLWGGWSSAFFFSPIGQMEKDFGDYLEVITDAPTLPSGLSITGPTRIQPGATCLWTGHVTGGTTPYTYSWTNDGFTVSNTDSYRGGKLDGETGSSFMLEFIVINDAGQSSTQITVQEDSNAPICRN